jgi:glycosyltransferase involved in cell wall biosynthesis
MIGPFGLRPKGTMSVRALPMARALAVRGHSVTVILPPWQNPEDAGQHWEEDGVAVENVPLPPRVPGLFYLLTALRLARRALALRPDVVHLFKPKAYSGLAHWLLSWLPRARRPCLVVDTDDWEGPGGWNEIGGYTPAQRRFFAWQERWGLAHADTVTVASRALESLVWALGVPPERVFYVPNGVAESKEAGSRKQEAGSRKQEAGSRQQEAGSRKQEAGSRKQEAGSRKQEAGSRKQEAGSRKQEAGSRKQEASDDQSCILHPAPCILLYTRFFEFSVSRVVEILRRVRESVPEARLLVVGKGFSGEEEELFRLATQSGLTVQRDPPPITPTRLVPDHADQVGAVSRFTHDVTYLGWVPFDTLPAYFAQATLAIYPFDDTLVNRTKCAVKLGDLLAAGVPVVADAVGQNREYIRHGETGWLVSPGDVPAFAEAVVRLLQDAQLRQQLGRAAARDLRERFAWARLVETVERAYAVGQSPTIEIIG